MEEELRAEILEKVKLLYNYRKKQEKFIPGETSISYAGRIYDEKDDEFGGLCT